MAKKRANGEGSIRKRKDGRWEGRYTVGYDKNTGKQVFKNILGKSQAEVRDKLKSAIEESEKLDFNKAGKYTLCEWIRIWYEVYIKNSIRETTAEYYRNYIENHIIAHLGSTKLEKLTTVQIQKAYNEIKDHGRIQKYDGMKNLALSDRTVRGIHIILHECLEQAVRERIISYITPQTVAEYLQKKRKK